MDVLCVPDSQESKAPECRWSGPASGIDTAGGKSYHSFSRGEWTFHVGDFVSVRPSADDALCALGPCGRPAIVQLTQMWEEKGSGAMVAEARMMLRPGAGHGAPETMPYHGSAELVAGATAASFATLRASDVDRKVVVEDLAEFARRKSFPQDVYYCREAAAVGSARGTVYESLAKALAAAGKGPRPPPAQPPASSQAPSSSRSPSSRLLRAQAHRLKAALLSDDEDGAEEEEAAAPTRVPAGGADDDDDAGPVRAAKRCPEDAVEEPGTPLAKRARVDLSDSEETASPLRRLARGPKAPSSPPPPRILPLDSGASSNEVGSPKAPDADAADAAAAVVVVPSSPGKTSALSSSQRLLNRKKQGTLMSWIEQAESGAPPRMAVVQKLSAQPKQELSPQKPVFFQSKITPLLSQLPKTRLFGPDELLPPVEEMPAPTASERKKKEEPFPLDLTSPEASGSISPALHSTSSFIVDDHQSSAESESEDEGGQSPPSSAALCKEGKSKTVPLLITAGGRRGDISAPLLYTLRQAFDVYLQFIASACADRDFIDSLAADGGEEHRSYFLPGVQKIERELLTKKECVITSSAWNQDFLKGLIAFPTFKTVCQSRKGEIADDPCQACKRGKHSAGFTITLYGPEYDPESLWQGDITGYLESRANKESAAPTTVQFRVGKMCNQRAFLFHRLEHYKSILINSVLKRLEKCSEDAGTAVQTVLDDSAWVSERYDNYKRLLTDADNFGLSSKTE
eukprot:m51a1_g800 hypothetical protein (743) ;mRNA; r:653603-656301